MARRMNHHAEVDPVRYSPILVRQRLLGKEGEPMAINRRRNILGPAAQLGPKANDIGGSDPSDREAEYTGPSAQPRDHSIVGNGSTGVAIGGQ